MNPNPRPSLFARLRQLAAPGPMVVAHRGDSRNHPENTLPAFRAATALGVPMQEFDVQVTADGALICLHDETLDRTTDSAHVLGPGALLAQATLAEVQRLDAGAWKGERHRGARVPTLEQALVAMDGTIPMIEHKAGRAREHVAELRRLGAMDTVLLQSFDWAFVAEAAELAPELALALLGPTAAQPVLGAAVVDAARRLNAGMIHWSAAEVGAAAVRMVHDAGLLLCTYTSDDELAWCGGARLGFDAMCTNDPGRMLARQRDGALGRQDPGRHDPGRQDR